MGVHLPYSPKWYWPVEGFYGVPEMDRYFDRENIFSRFLKTSRQLLHLNDIIMESIQREEDIPLIYLVLSSNNVDGILTF